jgi:hypothetical protein
MIEIKDATINIAGKTLLEDCSFIAHKGQITAILGCNSEALSALVQTFLGFQPLNKGYVSIDGEEIMPLSAPFFRQKIAYVPVNFSFGNMQVSELLCTLMGNSLSVMKEQKKALWKEWEALAIERSCYDAVWESLPADVQQRIVLSVTGMLDRKMILMNQPTLYQTEESQMVVTSYIKSLSSEDSVVCFTTMDEESAQVADVIVKLTM